MYVVGAGTILQGAMQAARKYGRLADFRGVVVHTSCPSVPGREFRDIHRRHRLHGLPVHE